MIAPRDLADLLRERLLDEQPLAAGGSLPDCDFGGTFC